MKPAHGTLKGIDKISNETRVVGPVTEQGLFQAII